MTVYRNVLADNRAALEHLKKILAEGDTDTHALIVYGFATPDGTSQRNLTLSIERARAVEHRLVEELAANPSDRPQVQIETTGRGESWPYQKLIPNLSITPPSALVALCPAEK